ncbi:Eco57I restriction-modification methylase domain-containing protein [Bordetella bronchiseptica]|uniref:Eco57I restriction-modification methylase domain-containing protein n=1 Tax=Bordetella bronchiseptica TaxID=518 RepID=UPI0013F60735|nr:N-6 DNA methylase [Bordetella bronchiseptica]
MKRIRKAQATLNLPTLKLEGGLFLPDQLEKAAQGRANAQLEADYGTPKGVKLKDEYSRAFQIACAQWQHFAAQIGRADIDAAQLTMAFIHELLRDAFGYATLQATAAQQVGELRYPVSLMAGSLPVLVAPHTLGLDEADACFAVQGGGNRKKAPFQAMQELLNASEPLQWGIVSNGKQLRLLRDAASLTRPSFLEVDLADLLGGQRYAEFANVWRLLHASRASHPGQGATACIWEQWRSEGQQEGSRVREGLRNGVEQALLTLGAGFLQHPANHALRAALHEGTLSKDAYFQQLLRLIYRLIFVFTVEERGVLHPQPQEPYDSAEALAARRAYAEGYGLARLRELCLKRRARTRHDDQWQAIRIVFRGLAQGEPRLALPALGGLFAPGQCPDLDAASLDNAHLLAALQHLRWAKPTGAQSLVPVDYCNMGPEELGSVYESLLELVPAIDLPARTFGFVGRTEEGSTAGNARKLTGSYYTPDSLVQELIKSALDPVIEQRLGTNPANPTEALLTIRVIDPACGSGHFLLAAARRLAEKLAQLRSLEGGQEGAIQPQDYRHALREVVARCIYGVDRNPMAIELARMALWLEGYEEGRPLSFLDHHLQVGDALLGLADLNMLEQGIAKDAFKPLSGDDKDVCKALAKANAAGLKQIAKDLQGRQMLLGVDNRSGLEALRAIETLPADMPEQVAAKEQAWRHFLEDSAHSPLAHAADALVGAYLLPKTEDTAEAVPTSITLHALLTAPERAQTEHATPIAAARAACEQARVFHWPLAYPQVFAQGGFDCVLGNPPWEIVQNRDDAVDENFHERQKKWFGNGVYAVLSGRRDLYKLFLAVTPYLLNAQARCGFILPIGFMFEDDCGDLRKILFNTGSVISILHLQNGLKKFFPDVDARYRFVAITLAKHLSDEHRFSTVVCSPSELREISWHEIHRDQFDQILGFERSAVIYNDLNQANIHSSLVSKLLTLKNLEYRIVAEFHASSDKDLFFSRPRHDTDWTLLKNGSFHYFNPRFGLTEKWVRASDVQERAVRKGLDPDIWLASPRVVFRDIARNDDTRTLISCLVPAGFVSTYDAPMLVPMDFDQQSELALAFYAGYLSSFFADFIIRPYVDKHIKGYVLAHLPIPEFSPENHLMLEAAELALSLSKDGWRISSYADDHRITSVDYPDRITLEAIFLRIVNASPREIKQIFSGFPSIQASEFRKYEEYRTQRLVLEAWERLEQATPVISPQAQPARPGTPFRTYVVGHTPATEAEDWLAGLVCDILLQAGTCDDVRLRQILLTTLPEHSPHRELLSEWLHPLKSERWLHICAWLRSLLGVPTTASLSIRNSEGLVQVLGDDRTTSLARALIEARQQQESALRQALVTPESSMQTESLQKRG